MTSISTSLKSIFDVNLLFTDTDRLTENVYEDFFKWKDLLDFGNYPKDSKFFNKTNKKVIGKIKDEFGEVILEEFFRRIKVKNVFY